MDEFVITDTDIEVWMSFTSSERGQLEDTYLEKGEAAFLEQYFAFRRDKILDLLANDVYDEGQ